MLQLPQPSAVQVTFVAHTMSAHTTDPESPPLSTTPPPSPPASELLPSFELPSLLLPSFDASGVPELPLLDDELAPPPLDEDAAPPLELVEDVVEASTFGPFGMA